MKLASVIICKLKMMLGDRLFLGAMIALPLLITVAAGYALRYEKMNVIPVALVDEDNTEYSKTLLDRLGKKEGFRISVVTAEKAAEMLKGNQVEGIFIIREGFQDGIVKGESRHSIDVVKSPSSFSMDFLREVVAGEVMRFITGNMAVRWVSDEYERLGIPVDDSLKRDILEYTDSQWEPEPLMTIRYMEWRGGKAEESSRVSLPAATATSAGLITIFIMFYILFSSSWLVEERINGTLKRLVAGPDALGLSFAGNVLALFIAGAIQIGLFSAVNRFVFGIDLFPGMLSYLVFAVYLLSVISISMFLSSILKTPAQLQAGAPVFALLTGFAGGCFWNFLETPERLRMISALTPQSWALRGINALLVDPGSLSGIMAPVLVLFMISLILLPLSYIIINSQVA